MSGFRSLCDKYVAALSSNVRTVGEVATLLEHTAGSDQEKKTCLDVAFRKALLNKVGVCFGNKFLLWNWKLIIFQRPLDI